MRPNDRGQTRRVTRALTLERAGATALSELYPPGSLRTYAGFGLVRSRTAYGSAGVVHTAAVAVVPFWAVAAAAVAAPAAWLLRRRSARRRARLGLCGRCGYDLRATPGRCPECGTMPPAPPAA